MVTDSKPCGFSNRLFLVIVLFAVFISAFSFTSFSQTPDECRKLANKALSEGEFERAIAYLELLDQYLGESKNNNVITMMAMIYFRLGFCYFFTGRFDQCISVYENKYIKRYPKHGHVPEAMMYIGDSYRFQEKFKEAIKVYKKALKKYGFLYKMDQKVDIWSAIARCCVAQDKWKDAMPWLKKVYDNAPDAFRRSWAATLWTIAAMKEMELSKVYKMVPILLGKGSFASESVALNMTALETGDELFSEDRYRDAMWIYRLVYPRETIETNTKAKLSLCKKQSRRLKKRGATNLRKLLMVQERIGELENSLKILETVKDYDTELFFRIARSYMEIRRYRAAQKMFYHLYTICEKDKSDEALFLSFRCAMAMRPWDLAIKVGKEYMKEFPQGASFDELTLSMGRLYSKQQDWPEVIRHFLEALKINPSHQDIAECKFLTAYAYFMEENFAKCAEWLIFINKNYPGHPFMEQATYWLGMSQTFQRNYEKARFEFDDILTQYPRSLYKMDSMFRRAVCDYGLSKYKEGEKRLNEFVATYPQSKLTGEAIMMLADIAAYFGDLEKAVNLFHEAIEHPMNMELYNYCVFRCAEIMFGDFKDYDRTIGFFKEYISRDRPGSNIPQAVFYIGRSLWHKDEKKGALENYLDAVKNYGNNVKELGVDMILEEWVGKARGLPVEMRDDTWRNFKSMIREAVRNQKKVLALRLKRALYYEPGITDKEKKSTLDYMLKVENLPMAGPSVLQMIMDEALKREQKELAIAAAEKTIENFTETDYALDARMFLAKMALEKKDHKVAIRHLSIIREVFAQSDMAAEALIMLGDIYLEKEEYKQAEECFKSILSVKSWKKLWAAATYGRGRSVEGLKQFAKAAAYFERVYLMYSAYKKWAAKAYLARANCLMKLREYKKAAETLDELLSFEELKDYPEIEKAKKLLENVKQR